MRLLVTGAAGMLGQDVVSTATAAGHDVTPLARRELDIADAAAVGAALAAHRPDAVINCAAWTDVDGAESDEAGAARANADGPRVLAAATDAAGALLVHVSTDYVFAGDATEPYLESDPTDPRTAYGRTKLAGEEAIRAATGRHAIVRTAWVFGPGGRNFVDTMRALAAQRDEVTVVDDQVGCPTYTGHLAAALVEVAQRGLTGTLHVAGGGRCSWHDLAAATFAAIGSGVTLHRGSSADLDRPAKRPAYSVLASERDDTPRLPDWRDGLAAHLEAVRETITR